MPASSSGANDTTIVVRPARIDEAAPLSALAERLFCETFGPYTPPDDLTAYLAETYSPERQAAEIANPKGRMFVVDAQTPHCDSVLIGYAYLYWSTAPVVVRGPVPLELKRFYIDYAWHGRGIAQMLMADVLRCARELEAQTLWLSVWQHNPRAAAFYQKYGFHRVGEHVFPIGSDPQVDWLLARPLDAEAGVELLPRAGRERNG